ncbi:uncharacterized protein LOC123888044 [Trifolium pratense]|nr:uncharacterized protein LOC123888044 [Trifolium pratense]
MDIKYFIFLFFLCAPIIISVVAIESSKDGKQYGAIKEFKIKMGFTTWNTWNLYDPLQRLGNRKRRKGSKGSSLEENGGEGSGEDKGEPIEGGKDKESAPST